MDDSQKLFTDKILPITKQWQQRPLESIYAVVFLDVIHYHVRSEGQIVKKAVYIVMENWSKLSTYFKYPQELRRE